MKRKQETLLNIMLILSKLLDDADFDDEMFELLEGAAQKAMTSKRKDADDGQTGCT